MASLYRRKKEGKVLAVWWMKYYANGKCVRVSTGKTKRKEAQTILDERMGRVATGQPILPRVDRIEYEQAAKDLRQHYKTTGERDFVESETRLAHLDKFFKGVKLVAISGDVIKSYVDVRQTAGAANGTINRELGVLGRMLRLAYENGKLLRLPVIHKLKEAPPRSGFFELGQFEAVKRHLRPDLQVAVSIAYTLGWRMQSEVLTLKRSQVDLNACTMRLDPGTTKNDEGRVVYLTQELHGLLQGQLERVQQLEKKLGKPVPFLFPYFSKRHKGKRILDFRQAWETACMGAMLEGLEGEEHEAKKAELKLALVNGERPGLLKLLRHDFRRTAVRNMVNRGVPERVAMKITGHRTRTVFDRYHIISPSDLQEAARKLTGTLQAHPLEKAKGVALATP